MDSPGELLLNILCFLNRFEAEKNRLVCRKWSNVVMNNETAWSDKIFFYSITNVAAPVGLLFRTGLEESAICFSKAVKNVLFCQLTTKSPQISRLISL